MNLKIQVVSDIDTQNIHPENYKAFTNKEDLWRNFIYVTGDIVVLAGNIGNPNSDSYWSFIQYVSSKCRIVLITAGVSEYTKDYSNQNDIDNLIRTRSKIYKNVRFLQRNYFIVDNVVFLGCTLWNYVPPEHITTYNAEYNNFKNKMHFQDLDWIASTIKNFRNEGFKIVILSSYVPSFDLDGNYIDTDRTSDLSFLFPHISAWIYGNARFNISDNHIYYIKPYKTMFISNHRTNNSGLDPKQHINHKYRSGFYFNLNDIPDQPQADMNFKNPYDSNYLKRLLQKYQSSFIRI